MRTLLTVFGTLATLAGIALIAMAVITPSQYAPTTQTLQLMTIYAEGIFKAVLGIACFVFAGLCLLSINTGITETGDSLVDVVPSQPRFMDATPSQAQTPRDYSQKLGNLPPPVDMQDPQPHKNPRE